MRRPLALALRCALGFAVLTLAPAAQAQRATLSGYVRDAATGETLLGANVLVVGTDRGTGTNTSGFYALPDLAPGTYAVAFSFLGYTTRRDTVTLAAGEARRLDVALRPEAVTGGEVVVEGQAPIEEQAQVGLQTLPIRLVQQLPSVFEADLFRSIQLLPGVKASSDFSSKLYIRGGSPDQTLIQLDGTTVYNPTHFFGFFSTFNTEAIKDVRLYKGAYPALYGGRLGAVIDVYNRDGNRNEREGMVQVGLLASRAGVEGPLAVGGTRGSFMVAVRRSTLEPLLAVLREQLDGGGIPESFYFYDVNARVGLDLSPNDRLSISGYAGRDLVGVPLGEGTRFDLDYGNRTLSAAYNRVLSGTVFAQLRATASQYFSRPTGSIGTTGFERPNTITDYSGRLDVEWLPGQRFELRGGAWAGLLNLRLRSEFNEQVGIDFVNPSTYGSGYVQARIRPTPEWIVTTGLRADAFRSDTDNRADAREGATAGYVRLAPHVQVERLFGPNTVAQFAAGRYNQFLSLISTEAFSGFDTWVTTGTGVPPQASEQAVLGLKTRLSEAYRLDVEVYGRTLRELFDIRPEVQDVAGLSYEELFRFGEGYAYGTEVLLERGVGRLTGLVSYTLATTRRRYPAEPAFAVFFPPKYDRTHDVSVVVNYDLGRRWTLTLAGVYSTGQAYTLPVGRDQVNLPFGDAFDGLYSVRLNSQRLPPYHRMDAGVTRTGRFFRVADYEVQFQIVNLYNRRNVWFIQYDFEENPVEATEVRQLPILPNLSFSLRF